MEAGWQVGGRSDYVDQLIAALGHPELQTPRRVAWILGELATPRAVDPLLRVLATTEDPYLQAAAAEALGKIGEARAVSGLVQTLAHGFLPARLSAAVALGEIGGPLARTELVRASLDPNGIVRQAAAQALDRLGARRSRGPVR